MRRRPSGAGFACSMSSAATIGWNAMPSAFARERHVGLFARASREDRQSVAAREPFEQPGLGDPALAMNQASGSEKDGLEVVDDLVVGDTFAEVRANLLGQRPVVIPAALVLVVLYLSGAKRRDP